MNRRTLLLLLTLVVLLPASGGAVRQFASARAGTRLLVRLRAGTDAAALSVIGGEPVVARWPAIDQIAVAVQRASPSHARSQLLRDARVLSVSEDQSVVAAQEPSDQTFTRQWALAAIQAPFAWELTHGSNAVTIAVLDSGVDLTHPDLRAHILAGGCNVVADGGCLSAGKLTPPQDQDGHGSAVAGIAAAVTDNGVGIAGVAWNASILPVRVLSGGSGRESDVITGLMWAVDQGAQVVNLSFNEPCGQPESSALKDALGYAWSHGAVVVAASGNDSACASGSFPAADPHVLAVAATDMDDKPSPNSTAGSWVRASAPGEGILTTTTNGDYAVVSGTSYAAPFVSGLAALLMSIPGATNTQVVNWITSTCDVPSGWNSAGYGCGRINAFRAVSLAMNGSDPHTSSTAPITVHLAKGLNNLLYLGPSRRPATAFASLEGKIGTVYTWDPIQGRLLAYLPNQASASDIQTVVERQAYWVYMNSPADLVMQPTGDNPPPQLTLPPGWNNVPLPAGTLPVPLQRLSMPIGGLWAWDPASSGWKGYFVGASEASTLTAVQATSPYWLYAPAKLTVRYGP